MIPSSSFSPVLPRPDRGRDDHVREGMVVVADGGMVGRVVKSYAGVARVLLLTDSSSAVNVMVQRTRAAGVMVASVSGSDLALFKDVKVAPTVPFRTIEEVLVITDFLPQKLP